MTKTAVVYNTDKAILGQCETGHWSLEKMFTHDII